MSYTGLILDDAKSALQPYIDRLNKAYEFDIYFCGLLREAIDTLNSDKGAALNFLIIDAALACETFYTTEETNHGKFTGLCLIKDIRNGKFIVNKNVPIVIFSNHRNDPEIIRFAERNTPCIVVNKLPFIKDFAKTLRDFIEEKK